MNACGVFRGYMSKSFSNETFIKLVAEMIEKQLQEWNHLYEVFLIKLANYEIMIKTEKLIIMWRFPNRS